MTRYDESFRYGRSLYGEGFGRFGHGEDAGWGGEPAFDHFPRGHQRQRGSRTDARGWSRPEYNVSFGFPADQNYDTDFRRRGGSAGASEYSAPFRGWRTGEPWGEGPSAVDSIRARDLMTRNPEAVTPDSTLADVARRMRDLDVGVIPVIDDADRGILKGLITDRDIAVRAVAEAANMDTARVGDYMSEDIASVDEADSVRDIATVMKRKRVRRVPVTDYTGRLVGIIALADLAVDYARLDEDRELEVEEVFERVSEPARPRRIGSTFDDRAHYARGPQWSNDEYDRHFRDRLRAGWHQVKRGARNLLQRDYDRDMYGPRR